MDITLFNNATDNELIEHVVYDDHTLGYAYKCNGQLMLSVLAGKIKGGLNWRNGPHSVGLWDIGKLRKATKADFKSFRCSDYGVKF